MPTNMLKGPLAALVILGLCAPALAAEDRMAGDGYIAPSRQAGSQPGESASSTPAVLPKEVPGTVDVDFAALESRGVLLRALDGGLGLDLWRSTKRSTLTELLPALPENPRYRTLQDLQRRALLTTIDAKLVKNDVRPQAGNDLTTLRIEKLLDIGAYEEAMALYTQHPEKPYHERYARAGILAALYSRQPAIACLETKALHDRFMGDIFWRQLSGVCGYLFSKASETKTERPDIEGSKLLQKIVEKDDYRFKVRKPEDLNELTPLEVAVLAADKRLDMSSMDITKAGQLPLHVVTLMMKEPSLAAEERFALTVQAVKRGVMPAGKLASFYEAQANELFGKGKKTSLTDYKQLAGWKRPVYLYRAASNAAAGREQAAIMEQALALVPSYGTAPLWPFASIIAGLDPADLDRESIRAGFTVLLETDSEISPAWVELRFSELAKTDSPNQADLLQYVAYKVGSLSTGDSSQDIDITKASETLGQERLRLLKIIYEKLDSDIKLHNIGGTEFYEKGSGLTSAVDYVMPLGSLMEDLDSAERDKRLGEVILLSSIALREVPPEQMDGTVLGEVIGGLKTVGLTKEARSLAREVMLGFEE